MGNKEIFIRLDAVLCVSEDDMDKILSGDDQLLDKMVNIGHFRMLGGGYIPGPSITDYNAVNGTDYKEDDIDFR